MLRTAVSIPVGTAKNKQKNRPKMAVFLLLIASFRVKTGVKKSYALRVSSLYEPAISELVLLKINPSQIGKLYQHFLISYVYK